MFSGRWRLMLPDGTPVLENGKQKTIHFDKGGYFWDSVIFYPPRGDIGWVDFHTGDDVSRAIYRREGNRVLFGQGAVGEPRPTSFEQGMNWCRIHPEEFGDCSEHDHLCGTLWLIEPVNE